ncbi:MAG: curli-like amyloid fiber formation chaperone CsgH [Terricaulis sp.]
MVRILASLAALIAASACVASAQTSEFTDDRSSAAECAIDVTRTRHGALFEASARAFESASGEYEFTLSKDDGDGSSDLVQGGAFSLGAGEQDLLGSSELSLERGGRYRARLVLWDGDEVICRAERRS